MSLVSDSPLWPEEAAASESSQIHNVNKTLYFVHMLNVGGDDEHLGVVVSMTWCLSGGG